MDISIISVTFRILNIGCFCVGPFSMKWSSMNLCIHSFFLNLLLQIWMLLCLVVVSNGGTHYMYNQADVLQLLSHIIGSVFHIWCNQSLGRFEDDRHGRLLRQTSSTCPPEFQPWTNKLPLIWKLIGSSMTNSSPRHVSSQKYCSILEIWMRFHFNIGAPKFGGYEHQAFAMRSAKHSGSWRSKEVLIPCS